MTDDIYLTEAEVDRITSGVLNKFKLRKHRYQGGGIYCTVNLAVSSNPIYRLTVQQLKSLSAFSLSAQPY